MANFCYYKTYAGKDNLYFSADLANHKTAFELQDTSPDDSLCGFGLTHVYRSDYEETVRYGKGFFLNIMEKFEKQDDGTYVYTDYLGDCYTLKNNKYKDMELGEAPDVFAGDIYSYKNLTFSSSLEEACQRVYFWLTNDKVIKGFNNFGNLVLVSDKNGNYYHIIYEVQSENTFNPMPTYIREIPCTVDNYENYTLLYQLCYSSSGSSGKLTSIKDEDGNTLISYQYSGDYLTSVSRANGLTYTLSYTSQKLVKAVTSNGNGLKISTSGNTITCSLFSAFNQIPNATETNAENIVDSLSFDFGTSCRAVVKSDESNWELFIFESDYLSYHYEMSEGRIIAAEKYTYNPTGESKTLHAAKDSLLGTDYNAVSFDGGESSSVVCDENYRTIKTTSYVYATSLNTFNSTVVEYSYNSNGKLSQTKTTVSIYQTSGTPTVFIQYADYTYTYYHNVQQIKRYYDGESDSADITEYEYFSDNFQPFPKKIKQYNAAQSSLANVKEYDKYGRKISETDFVGRVLTLQYVTGTRRILSVGDSSSVDKQFTYDELNNLSEISIGGVKNLIGWTNGEVTSVTFNTWGVAYEYNEKRRIKSTSWYSSNLNSFVYDDDNPENVTITNALGEVFSYQKSSDGTSDSYTYKASSQSSGVVQEQNIYDYENRYTVQKDCVTGTSIKIMYDVLDRPVQVRNVSDISDYSSASAGTLTENYEYDSYGNVTKAVFSGTYAVTYTFTYSGGAHNRLNKITISDFECTPKYDSLYRYIGKSVFRYGTCLLIENITYESGLPTKLACSANISTSAENIIYTYDSAGRIKTICRGDNLTSYTYDNYNRLVREDNQVLGYTYYFEYDSNGQRTTRYRFDYTTGDITGGIQSHSGKITYYTYSNGKFLTDGSNASCSYDKIGNPTSYRGATAIWKKGLLTSYFGSTFSYDGQGRRIQKDSVTYTYDSSGRLIESSDGMSYLYDHTGLFGFKYNGTSYLYRKDLQGNIVAILDSNGYLVYRYEYDAWGNYNVYDEDGTKVSYSGRTYPGGRKNPTKLCDINPFTYRGYFHDCETGLYYLQSRYYDPDTGMFVSADDVSYIDPMERSGLNLYAYCNNNPVMYTDPTGELSILIFVAAAVVGFGIGLGTSAITQAAFNGGQVNWITALIDGGFSAVSSMIMMIPGLNAFAVGAINVGISFANGVITTGLENDWDYTWKDWTAIGVSSAVAGVASGVTKGNINKLSGKNSLTQAHKFVGTIEKRIITGYYNNSSKLISKSLKSAASQMLKELINLNFGKGFGKDLLITLLQSAFSASFGAGLREVKF